MVAFAAVQTFKGAAFRGGVGTGVWISGAVQIAAQLGLRAVSAIFAAQAAAHKKKNGLNDQDQGCGNGDVEQCVF